MFLFLPLLSFKSVQHKKHLPANPVYTGAVQKQSPEGKWTFQQFGENIIKTSFEPVGYFRNEQPSDAVIMKPSSGKGVTIDRDGQAVVFNKTATLTSVNEINTYHFAGQYDILAEYFAAHEYRGFRFQLQVDEKIYGGGERALPMDRRGYGFRLYNSPAFGYGEGADQLNFSVPFLISSRGYGIFFDNASSGYFDIGRKDPSQLEAAFTSGELTFYIIKGKNTADVLKHYTSLVGRQPVPARWVFGNLMSRFGYRSEEQVTSTLAAMKAEKFPVDAVILDLFWFGDSVRNTMGNLEWINTKNWPDPEGMVRKLDDQGIRTILITEPYVVMGTKNYSESRNFHAVDSSDKPYTLTNFYFGFGGLLDLFRKDTQDWFWQKYRKQIDMGIAGWWGDLGEPETHPDDLYHNLDDLGFDRLFRAPEVHNLYGHYWNRMMFEKYRQYYPETRLFNLNRSGFAGSQRYGIFPWSGDVGRNWSGLRAQLPVMLGMSLCGVPYIHADAGGFAFGEKDPELYTRWLQFAAFTPVFRPHGTAMEELDPHVPSIESEPVYYPEPYKSIVRRYIQLRYNLLPYNYTLAYQQATEGKPLTRPMFFNDSEDKNLPSAEDQYMWGENILVAPVLHKGASSRKLYLPKGNWYKYYGNTLVKGGQWINELVRINNIPLYVKAGSFIPSCSNLLNTNNYQGNTLQVTYYPDSSGSSYTMYDDDGKTNQSFENNQFELIHFKASVNGRNIRVEISSNGGRFKGRPESRKIIMKIPGLSRPPVAIEINDHLIKAKEGGKPLSDNNLPAAIWDAAAAQMTVEFEFTGKSIALDLVR